MDRIKVKEKTRKAYDKVGADYDNWYWMKSAKKLRAEMTDKTISILKRELKGGNRGRPKILDLCCGTGYLVGPLYSLGDYTGLDFSKSMITYCKAKYPKSEFVQGDAEKMPFKDKTFDAVVCFWSFHHMMYPEKALDEIQRVLKPGGVALIATFKDTKLNFVAKLADLTSSAYWGFATVRYSKSQMGTLVSPRFKSLDVEIYPRGFAALNSLGIRFLIVTARR